ncbi:VOC family protein [Variovorax sp. J22P240]|uniref:VOC family protein n=1 Tax=Variovorax sp. J22P240 TaxID=3053514 RepID=UPI00257618AC|nr:VOC family protein [Variovorax sp. J22P240]MDM0003043.1 VOC family protein [Variovorax sp. J22P240]
MTIKASGGLRSDLHKQAGYRTAVITAESELHELACHTRGVHIATMKIASLDHIVLCVARVDRTIEFYQRLLGMEAREERPGKWSLHFGSNKISLQEAGSVPDIARSTAPGSGNFCVLTRDPVVQFSEELRSLGIEIVAGPGEREGATGKLLSVYFRDPDGNLVEVSNPLPDSAAET